MSCRLLKQPSGNNNYYSLLLTPNIQTSQRLTSSKVKSTQCTNNKQASFSFFHSTPQISVNNNVTFKSKNKLHKSTEDKAEPQPILHHNNNSKSKRIFNKSKSANSFSNLNRYSSISNIIPNEKMLSSTKQRIKGKLRFLMNKSHVYNNEMLIELNKLFHEEDQYSNKEDEDNNEENKNNNKNNQHKNQKSLRMKNFSFKMFPELFSKERSYFRYEDYYQTPIAFLSKHFTEKEISIMKSAPFHFGLKSKPFKGSDIKMFDSLQDQLNHEEKEEEEEKRVNSNSLRKIKEQYGSASSSSALWLIRNKSSHSIINRSSIKQTKINLSKRATSTASVIFYKAIPNRKSNAIDNRVCLFDKRVNRSMLFPLEKSKSKIREMETRRKESIKKTHKMNEEKKKEFIDLLLNNLKAKEKEKEKHEIVHNIQSKIGKNYMRSQIRSHQINQYHKPKAITPEAVDDIN